MIRFIRPLDVLSIVPLCYKTCNEARIKEKITSDCIFYSSVVSPPFWPARKKKLALIGIENNKPCSLVSLRKRSGDTTFEVENLVLLQGANSRCVELLEKLNLLGDKFGIHKIFLRVPSESRIEAAAKQAGFVAYSKEFLNRVELAALKSKIEYINSGLSLRLPSQKEEYDLYNIFIRNAPPSIVEAEGMTYQEWRDSMETVCVKPRGNGLVVEDKSGLLAYIKWFRKGSAVQIEIEGNIKDDEKLDSLVKLILFRFKRYRVVYFLTRGHQGKLQQVISRYGFYEVERYELFLKQLAIRVPAPRLVAARA